ncbi:hypothetical protein E4U33_000417 [Claviceps sp. LM78 group G4]|nr:hypothetical protein E4U33_000417 [Claviceps sp. LM78 group G4]
MDRGPRETVKADNHFTADKQDIGQSLVTEALHRQRRILLGNAYAGEAHDSTSLRRVCRRGPDSTRTDEAHDQPEAISSVALAAIYGSSVPYHIYARNRTARGDAETKIPSMSSTVDEIYAGEHQTEASPILSHGLLNIWVSTQRLSNIDLRQPTPSHLFSKQSTEVITHSAGCG